jgi:hypothetical protein
VAEASRQLEHNDSSTRAYDDDDKGTASVGRSARAACFLAAVDDKRLMGVEAA